MIFKIFIIWRLGLLILSIWGLMVIQNVPIGISRLIEGTISSNYLKSQIQWDGGHYLSIAKFGYLFASDFAFFPLFPLLVKSLTAIAGNELFWGLLISNVSFFLFLTIIYILYSRKYSKKIAQNIVVTFLFFPTAFFATVYYSESFFLLLVALSLYALNYKKYLLAAILICLSSLTRMIGSFLIISFFYKYFAIAHSNKNLINKDIIFPILSASGVIIYTIFFFTLAGNPFEFNSVQSLWGRQVTDPLTVLVSHTWSLITSIKSPIDYLDYILTILFLTILILGKYKIPSSLWVFSMFSILVPISSGTLTSMPRYILASIGTFVILGMYLDQYPNFKIPFWSISLILQIILYVRFLNGFWVA